MIDPDQLTSQEQRFHKLKLLRAKRRASARGEDTPSPYESLASPLLPPWMRPSSLETASPLAVDIPKSRVRKTQPATTREYPSSIGALGSNY